MKYSMRLPLLVLVSTAATFLSACQSASFVRTDSRTLAAVPTVLEANPDILGGFIGREAVGSRRLPQDKLDKNQRAELDQRAYVIWKHSQNT